MIATGPSGGRYSERRWVKGHHWHVGCHF